MRNKQWTKEELQAIGSTLIVVVLLIGMFFYGKMEFFTDKNNEQNGDTVSQQLFISGTGIDIKNAFDNNLDTAWFGEEGYYSNFNYLTIDFKKLQDVEGISLILGNDGGPPINYKVSIESSTNNAIWRDVVGGAETGFFDGKQEFTYKFVDHKARYLRIGIKVTSNVAFQKFRVYEIKVNSGGE